MGKHGVDVPVEQISVYRSFYMSERVALFSGQELRCHVRPKRLGVYL